MGKLPVSNDKPPTLGYATQVWSPKSIDVIKRTERIQRGATKFILNLQYMWSETYKERLILSNLIPLSYWHEYLDILFFYKSINRHVIINNNVKLLFIRRNFFIRVISLFIRGNIFIRVKFLFIMRNFFTRVKFFVYQEEKFVIRVKRTFKMKSSREWQSKENYVTRVKLLFIRKKNFISRMKIVFYQGEKYGTRFYYCLTKWSKIFLWR